MTIASAMVRLYAKVVRITDRITPLLLAIVCLHLCSVALDNGLARTPPMGWNSWATYELNINEALIRSVGTNT